MENSKDKIFDENIMSNYGYNKDNNSYHIEDENGNICEDENCNCGHDHHQHFHVKSGNHGYFDKKTGKVMCELEDGVVCTNCGACDMCDLDPTKVCDNCGKCLDMLETDEKGYVHVPVDKIIMDEDETTLDELYQMYGLDDKDEEE